MSELFQLAVWAGVAAIVVTFLVGGISWLFLFDARKDPQEPGITADLRPDPDPDVPDYPPWPAES